MTTDAMPRTGAGGRHDHPDIIRWRYRQTEKVETYEHRRYGNIRRSLPHFMDCDAIQSYIRRYCSTQQLKALDLACGTGRLTRTLATRDLTIVSSDYSETMLAEAVTNAREVGAIIRPLRADGFRLPIRSDSLDVVFTIRFLRHFKAPDRSALYAEIRRVLKPDGIVVFDVINVDVDVDVGRRQVWDEPYTRNQIRDELTVHGFHLEELVAGNVVNDPVYMVAKKWSLIAFGVWYGRRIRGQAQHVQAATSWVACARKTELRS